MPSRGAPHGPSGPEAHRATAAATLVGGFEAKALSDLELAQGMARPGTSGHDLATALYLGQQSLEKMLKSVVILPYEGMRMGDGARAVTSLGHAVYPRIVEVVHARVAGVEAPCFGAGGMCEPGAARAARAYGQVARLWAEFSGCGERQELVWGAMMGAGLADGGLAGLNSWYAGHAGSLGGILGVAGVAEPRFRSPMFVPPPMGEAICDRRMVEAMQAALAAQPYIAARRALFRRAYEIHLAALVSRARDAGGNVPEPYGDFARRSVLEFWFQSVMSFFDSYMLVFPSNTLGRYPKAAWDGRSTSDLCGSQLDRVLYHVFVLVPCHVSELMHNSACLARLRDCGREAGFW